ncbi:Hypothetical protein Minf_0816 [Methylacidiphilum infernorum V4]|uniref:Uncharacterized protein n=1 Tax=Methylacidiphilum infernorum (isolate V4) TaxID=481448 RepID=B3E175_METI4|nr:Hypothetical protein Minf_0816 [Methylacidiphilum infernorum V4]
MHLKAEQLFGLNSRKEKLGTFSQRYPVEGSCFFCLFIDQTGTESFLLGSPEDRSFLKGKIGMRDVQKKINRLSAQNSSGQ